MNLIGEHKGRVGENQMIYSLCKHCGGRFTYVTPSLSKASYEYPDITWIIPITGRKG